MIFYCIALWWHVACVCGKEPARLQHLLLDPRQVWQIHISYPKLKTGNSNKG